MSAPALTPRPAPAAPVSVMPAEPRDRTPTGSRTVSHPEVDAVSTVLIAEDHEDSRDALRTLLEAFGYRVYVATNGREAVERALAMQPDLILMDVMMPEVDGLEATRTLRAAPGFRQVPIVAVTAMEGAREQVTAAGCDDMVTKPLDVRAFLERVRAWTSPDRAAS